MLYSEAIKTIAETLSRIADDLNKKGQYTDMLANLTEIVNAEIELPVKERKSAGERKPAKKSDNKFYYAGLECLDVNDDCRPVANRIVISRGETPILDFVLSKSLKWVIRKDTEKDTWFTVGKFVLPRHKMQARAKLLKVAREEIANPGSFYTKFVEPIGD